MINEVVPTRFFRYEGPCWYFQKENQLMIDCGDLFYAVNPAEKQQALCRKKII